MTHNDHDEVSETQPGNENPGAGCGFVAAGAGCLVAFAPLVLLDIRVSGFALIMSVPIGILIAIIGFATALGGAATGPAAEENSAEGEGSVKTNLPEMMGDTRTPPVIEPPSGPPPTPEYARQWDVTDVVARRLLSLNILGTIVVTVATVINVSVTWTNLGGWNIQLVGLIIAGQLCAIALAGWLLAISWRLTKTKDRVERAGRFAQLERLQRVIGVGSCAWTVALLLGWGAGIFGSDPIVIAAGLTPTLIGIIAMVITVSARNRIESDPTEGK